MQTDKASPGVTVEPQASAHHAPGHLRIPIGLVAIALCLIAATLVALTQRPHPDVLRTDFDLWDWWRSPIELDPRARLPHTDADMFGLCSSDDDLWVTGSGGLILHTGDGGQSWQAWHVGAEPLSPTDLEQAYRLALEQRSATQINNGAARAESQAQQQLAPPPRSRKEKVALNAIEPIAQAQQRSPRPTSSGNTEFAPGLYFPACASGGQVWIPGSGGNIYVSPDGGNSWTVEFVTNAPIIQTALGADETVYASSYGKGIWRKTGESEWVALPDTPCQGFHRLRTTLPATGAKPHTTLLAACTDDTGVFQFIDEGWQELTIGFFSGAGDAIPLDREGSFLLATDAGAIVASADDRLRFEIPLRSPAGSLVENPSLISLTQTDSSIWLVGVEGLVAELEWERADPRSLRERFNALNKLDPTATSFSENLLMAIAAPDRPDLVDLEQDSSGQLWVSGDGATLAYSPDNGKSWYPAVLPLEYSAPIFLSWRLPAPWYFVVVALGLLLSRIPKLREWQWELRAPTSEGDAYRSVAERAVSDAPLKPGDPDPVGIGRVARGISRFIRNRRTDSRLTIAITGDWGSGKSSLMNLLRHDLQSFGMAPVWFNAWHHQKGEQLLASLYANIREQGVPAWTSAPGIAFRFRLVATRVRKNPAGAFLAVVLLYLGITINFYAAELGAAMPQLAGAWALMSKDLSIDGSVLASVIPMAPALSMFVIALRAFGLRPSSLHKLQGETSRFHASELKPVARYHFATQFGEVTEALGPRRMVIFVDDLDRCEPAYVVEILEAVNLLVTSGDCFVVMGMDPRWVRSCISLRYQDIAKEIQAADSQQRDGAFAKNYLEKLVNISVPIPKAPPDAALSLLTTPAMARSKSSALSLLSGLGKTIGYGALGLAIFLATQIALWPSEQQSSEGAANPAAAVTAGSDFGYNTERALGQGKFSTSLDDDRMSQFGTPEVKKLPWWFWLGVTGLATTLVLWQRRGGEPLVIDDSDAFDRSINIWLPWIAAMHQTPRALKRFVNRLRFSAMRASALSSGAPPTPISLWQRLRNLLARGTKSEESRPEQRTVPEENLVALAAMTDVLGTTPQDWSDLRSSLVAELDWRLNSGRPPFDEAAEHSQRLRQRLLDTVTRYQAEFPASSTPSASTMRLIQELIGETPTNPDDNEEERSAESNHET